MYSRFSMWMGCLHARTSHKAASILHTCNFYPLSMDKMRTYASGTAHRTPLAHQIISAKKCKLLSPASRPFPCHAILVALGRPSLFIHLPPQRPNEKGRGLAMGNYAIWAHWDKKFWSFILFFKDQERLSTVRWTPQQNMTCESQQSKSRFLRLLLES